MSFKSAISRRNPRPGLWTVRQVDCPIGPWRPDGERFETNLVKVHLKIKRKSKMSDKLSFDQESVSLKPFSMNSLGIIS